MEKNTINKDEYIVDINIKDYKIYKVIGEGKYSKIRICKKKNNSKAYALKIISKSEILNKKLVDHIYNEYTLLKSLSHPFILNIKGKYFKDPKYIYFLYDFIPGGDLYHLLKTMQKFPIDYTKFYAAHIVCILDYMHNKNIVYRDIKPENFMIYNNGYLKLIDLGLAKDISEDNRTFTCCGTPQYTAPEVIKGEGYDISVDWWSFGIILYEMLIGSVPFDNENGDVADIYDKIIKNEYTIPKDIDESAKNLIRKLLKTNPNKRIGCNHNKIKDIFDHPFFDNFDWNNFIFSKLQPPYVPFVNSQSDTTNFDVYSDINKGAIEVIHDIDIFQNWV